MKDSFQTHKTATAGSLLLQEESKKISEKIKELQSHMQREKEKRFECLNSGIPDSKKVFSVEASTTHSASPEVENSLLSFLKSCGMDKYYENFMIHQVDDLQKLRSINESQLESFKIPLGHRLKILKQLRTFQDPLDSKSGLLWMKTSENQAFDEKNLKTEQNVFFRTQNKEKLKDPADEIETVLSFSISEKKPCWTCLKVVVVAHGMTGHSKFFCSAGCLDEFQRQEMRSCKCGKRFFRKEGIFFENAWICNICAENIGE